MNGNLAPLYHALTGAIQNPFGRLVPAQTILEFLFRQLPLLDLFLHGHLFFTVFQRARN